MSDGSVHRTAQRLTAAGGEALDEIVAEEVAVALVCGHRRVDVGAVGTVLSGPVQRLPRGKVEAATGYPPGAVSPLALGPGVSFVVADEEVFSHEVVNISSGDPTLSIDIDPEALRSVVTQTGKIASET